MTELSPPPIVTQLDVDLARKSTFQKCANGVLAWLSEYYASDTEMVREYLPDLLNYMDIPADCYPEMTETITYEVTFNASVEMTATIDVEVNLLSDEDDRRDVILDALENEVVGTTYAELSTINDVESIDNWDEA